MVEIEGFERIIESTIIEGDAIGDKRVKQFFRYIVHRIVVLRANIKHKIAHVQLFIVPVLRPQFVRIVPPGTGQRHIQNVLYPIINEFSCPMAVMPVDQHAFPAFGIPRGIHFSDFFPDFLFIRFRRKKTHKPIGNTQILFIIYFAVAHGKINILQRIVAIV